jgi:hypothetical protein
VWLSSAKLLDISFPTSTVRISGYFNCITQAKTKTRNSDQSFLRGFSDTMALDTISGFFEL